MNILDLVTFPGEDDRQRLVDLTRTMTKGAIRKLIKECEASAPKKK